MQRWCAIFFFILPLFSSAVEIEPPIPIPAAVSHAIRMNIVGATAYFAAVPTAATVVIEGITHAFQEGDIIHVDDATRMYWFRDTVWVPFGGVPAGSTPTPTYTPIPTTTPQNLMATMEILTSTNSLGKLEVDSPQDLFTLQFNGVPLVVDVDADKVTIGVRPTTTPQPTPVPTMIRSVSGFANLTETATSWEIEIDIAFVGRYTEVIGAATDETDWIITHNLGCAIATVDVLDTSTDVLIGAATTEILDSSRVLVIFETGDEPEIGQYIVQVLCSGALISVDPQAHDSTTGITDSNHHDPASISGEGIVQVTPSGQSFLIGANNLPTPTPAAPASSATAANNEFGFVVPHLQGTRGIITGSRWTDSPYTEVPIHTQLLSLYGATFKVIDSASAENFTGYTMAADVSVSVGDGDADFNINHFLSGDVIVQIYKNSEGYDQTYFYLRKVDDDTTEIVGSDNIASGDYAANAVKPSGSATIGNASDTIFSVSTNAGTRNCFVQVWEAGGAKRLVQVQVDHTDANTTTIKFAAPPASNEYLVLWSPITSTNNFAEFFYALDGSNRTQMSVGSSANPLYHFNDGVQARFDSITNRSGFNMIINQHEFPHLYGPTGFNLIDWHAGALYSTQGRDHVWDAVDSANDPGKYEYNQNGSPIWTLDNTGTDSLRDVTAPVFHGKANAHWIRGKQIASTPSPIHGSSLLFNATQDGWIYTTPTETNTPTRTFTPTATFTPLPTSTPQDVFHFIGAGTATLTVDQAQDSLSFVAGYGIIIDGTPATDSMSITVNSSILPTVVPVLNTSTPLKITVDEIYLHMTPIASGTHFIVLTPTPKETPTPLNITTDNVYLFGTAISGGTHFIVLTPTPANTAVPTLPQPTPVRIDMAGAGSATVVAATISGGTMFTITVPTPDPSVDDDNLASINANEDVAYSSILMDRNFSEIDMQKNALIFDLNVSSDAAQDTLIDWESGVDIRFRTFRNLILEADVDNAVGTGTSNVRGGVVLRAGNQVLLLANNELVTATEGVTANLWIPNATPGSLEATPSMLYRFRFNETDNELEVYDDNQWHGYPEGYATPQPTFAAAATLDPDTAQWNADELRGHPIATVTPANGDVLLFDSGVWGIVPQQTPIATPDAGAAIWNANKIQGQSVTTQTPAAADVFLFQSGIWKVVPQQTPVPVVPTVTSIPTATAIPNLPHLPLSGGTMTGALDMNGNKIDAEWIDSADEISSGIGGGDLLLSTFTSNAKISFYGQRFGGTGGSELAYIQESSTFGIFNTDYIIANTYIESPYYKAGGSTGQTVDVAIPDITGVTHTLNFKGGLLVGYSTAP